MLLLSTYELGHQPFGLAWPAAWLREDGFAVTSIDLSRRPLDEDAARDADLIGVFLPMHTATRLAARLIPRLRMLNASAHVVCFGLYAPLNEPYLRRLGADSVLAGEFEAALVERASTLRSARGDSPTSVSTANRSPAPHRHDLPPLAEYARLEIPGDAPRVAGYTEASRGCKHRCRHCPIVPVYRGRFRAVPREVVLADIRAQADAGAAHITFGDPDFLNGPRHARAVAHALHQEHPGLTWDMTVKIEHLVKHAELLPELRRYGCILATSAAESVDDDVLLLLEKGHTRNDILRALDVVADADIGLQLTFLPFTPWTTPASYFELLEFVATQDLIESVAPVQLALRLLVPAGSRLLEIPGFCDTLQPFDEKALCHPWQHRDPRVDALQREAMLAVRTGLDRGAARGDIFEGLRELASSVAGIGQRERRPLGSRRAPGPVRRSRTAIPYLTEPWYC